MFTIGKLFHLTQVVGDLDMADKWYNKIFAPCRFYRAYMPEAKRTASLLAVGNIVIEPVQPAGPDNENSPLGKFRAKFGDRLHSIAWYVDDLEACFDILSAKGIRLVDVAGKPVTERAHVEQIRYFWTHPGDTHGLLEFSRLNPEFTTDPRFQAWWSDDYWKNIHPLRLTGTVAITVVVADVGAAADFYATTLGSAEIAPTLDDGRRAFAVGDGTIVEIVGQDTDVTKAFGKGVLGMTFLVSELDSAERHLRQAGVPATRSGSFLTVAPEHALGTTVAFHTPKA